MKIHLCVVGKLRNGPEKELIDDYLNRFEKIGRAHGLGPVFVNEVEDKRNGGMPNEAILLQRVIPKSAKVIILDERGDVISSPNFAKKISSYANNSISDLAIIIGGADGIDPKLREQADYKISFGKMVWPHALVRVMISEQLYRAVSILAGSPYHRS
ncbi:23S rRNA (pseudouridine(1915)-N(3))-methyltransferase RlmH [Amylibacter sp.]|nr:23S rRNA (pseudouridine(1915)-N(3))-methyltransferase RlmH [Amylibacter sp.]